MRLGIFGGTFDRSTSGTCSWPSNVSNNAGSNRYGSSPLEFHLINSPTRLPPARRGPKCWNLPWPDMSDFASIAASSIATDPCYTVETLASLVSEDPARELFFVLGCDSLVDFPTWREPKRIAELAHLAVANRGGAPLPDLEPLRPLLGDLVESRVQFLAIPGIDVSSRDIRRRPPRRQKASAT